MQGKPAGGRVVGHSLHLAPEQCTAASGLLHTHSAGTSTVKEASSRMVAQLAAWDQGCEERLVGLQRSRQQFMQAVPPLNCIQLAPPCTTRAHPQSRSNLFVAWR